GGLDTRRMLTKGVTIDGGGKTSPIKTLVTIGTPHLGSPIADLIALKFADRIPFFAPLTAATDAALGGLLKQFGISLNGLHDLASEASDHFNQANPDQKGVKYLSVAGGGRTTPPPTSQFFKPFHDFMQLHSRGREPDDGVVAVSSAKWGDFDSNLWPADHAD